MSNRKNAESDEGENNAEESVWRDFYRRQIGNEEVDETMSLLRGKIAPGSNNVPPVTDDLRDVKTYLKVTRADRKLAGAATVVLAIAMAIVLLPSNNFRLRTPPDWQAAEGERMPDELRFRFGKTNATLEGSLFAMAGGIEPGNRGGGTTLTVRDASFSGTSRDGTPVRFIGSLVLTNVAGVIDVRRKQDFTGGTLVGKWFSGTNAPVDVKQPYVW